MGHHFLVEPDCLPNSDLQPFRRTTMPPISCYLELNDGNLTHHSPLFAPNLPEFTNWPVVETVHLVNSLQTPLLDH